MICDCCGKQLEVGELYYDIDGDILCEDCMKDNYSVINQEEPERELEGDPRYEPEYWEDR